MSDFNITSQQTPVEVDASIQPPLYCSGHEPSVLEQYGIQLDSLALFCIVPHLLSQFLRDYAFTWQRTSCSGHEIDPHHDGISIHADSDSWFRIPLEALLQFLKHGAFTEQPPFPGENGTPSHSIPLLIPSADLYLFLQRYALPASELTLFGNVHEIPAGKNDMLVNAPLLLIPGKSLSEFLQSYEILPGPSSIDNGDETPTVQRLEGGGESDPTSRTPMLIMDETPAMQQLEGGSESEPTSRTPMLIRDETPAVQQPEGGSESDPLSPSPTQLQDSDDPVGAQPDGATASILDELECPVCRNALLRVQERDRHVESHLPHSIHCPFQGHCPWTGRRQWDFKEHWKLKHPEAGKAPGAHTNEIYDPKDFVKSILDGKPADEVARSAFAMVQENLRRLGKPDVAAKVLGRSRELRNWIRIH